MFSEHCPICLNSLIEYRINGDQLYIWYRCYNKLCLSYYFLAYYKNYHNAEVFLYLESFYCGSIKIRNLFKEKICYLSDAKDGNEISLPIYISPNISLETLKNYLVLI